MSKPLVVLLAAVVATAVVVAGCGGSSESNESTESTKSLTKAEFLKQGNAICARGNKEIEEGFESFIKENHLKRNQRPTAAQLKAVAEEVLVPIIGRQVSEIRAIGIPTEEGQKAEKILDEVEESLAEAKKNPSLLTKENGSPFEEVNKAAKEFGLTKCGEE